MHSSAISQFVSVNWGLALGWGVTLIFAILFASKGHLATVLNGYSQFSPDIWARSAGAAIFIIVSAVGLMHVSHERIMFTLWQLIKLFAPLLVIAHVKLLSKSMSLTDCFEQARLPKPQAQDISQPSLIESEIVPGTQVYNLDILITKARSHRDNYHIHVIKSPIEELKEPAYNCFNRQEVQELLFYAQNLVAESADLKKLGRYLYNFLFPPTVKTVLDQSYGYLHENSLLRLRLRWGDYTTMHELAQLPWEYMHDGQQFLALDRRLSIVRYHHGRQPNLLTASNQLRVLVVASNPRNMPQLDLNGELEALAAAVSTNEVQGNINLRVEKNITARQLRLAIADFQPYILHFTGHGRREDKMGELMLCDEHQHSYPITADDLHVMLKGSRFMRLVVLGGCETAANPTANTAIYSVAGQLIDAGIPAVIGIQYDLPDDIAPSMMSDFYAAIANTHSLEQALTETRIGLYCDRQDKNYWALPVLFLRAAESTLLGPPGR